MSRRQLPVRSLAWLLLASCVSVVLAQGRLTFEPIAAPEGSVIQASATGLPPDTTLSFIWEYAKAEWDVAEGTFYGVKADEGLELLLSSVTSDADGNAAFEFTVPAGYGYVHNTWLRADGTNVARQGFVVQPTFEISPTSGPVGTPIRVRMSGSGYRFYEMVWHLLYDGAHTGWMNGLTSDGVAEFTIPATGAVGFHTLQAISGANSVPYLNKAQSINFIPQVPTLFSAVFEITEGDAVLPADAVQQQLPRITAPAPPDAVPADGPQLHVDYLSGTVDSPVTLTGTGFPADQEVTLTWTSIRGSRLTGTGFSSDEQPFGSVRTDADGAFTHAFLTPDDLGGLHGIIARAGDSAAELVYSITPSLVAAPVGPVEPGSEITIQLKGVGWTDTENAYTYVLDNGLIGYACAVHSNGDVTVTLTAPGQSGMHYLAIYPTIYVGEMNGPGTAPPGAINSQHYFLLPMLNSADHPDGVPVFEMAFEVL